MNKLFWNLLKAFRVFGNLRKVKKYLKKEPNWWRVNTFCLPNFLAKKINILCHPVPVNAIAALDLPRGLSASQLKFVKNFFSRRSIFKISLHPIGLNMSNEKLKSLTFLNKSKKKTFVYMFLHDFLYYVKGVESLLHTLIF